MSEYAVALRVDKPGWQEGCPLQIVALQISRNKETASCYLQSRVLNIGKVTISAIGLDATIVDANGTSETVEVITLDNTLEPGCSLSLPARHINGTEPQSIAALISRVDEDTNFGDPIQLPLPSELALKPKALSEREAQLVEAGVDPSACSRRHRDYGRWWLCGCGALNVLRNECHSCGAPKKLLAHLEDDELLSNAADTRAVERARAALSSNDPSAMKSAVEMLPDGDGSEELRSKLISKAAEIASKQKRLSRLAIIAGLCTVVVVGGCVLATSVIGPAMKRHQAEQLTSEGNYSEAMAIYAELDDDEKYEQTQRMQYETEGDEALANEDFERAIEKYEAASLDEKVKEAKFAYVEKFRDSTPLSWMYLKELKDCGYEGASALYSELDSGWSFDVGFAVITEDERKGIVDGGVWPYDWSDADTWQRGTSKSGSDAALANYGDRKYIYALFKATGGPKNISTKVSYSTTCNHAHFGESVDSKDGSVTLSNDGQVYCAYLDSDWLVTSYTIDSYYIERGRVDIGSKTISAR